MSFEKNFDILINELRKPVKLKFLRRSVYAKLRVRARTLTLVRRGRGGGKCPRIPFSYTTQTVKRLTSALNVVSKVMVREPVRSRRSTLVLGITRRRIRRLRRLLLLLPLLPLLIRLVSRLVCHVYMHPVVPMLSSLRVSGS